MYISQFLRFGNAFCNFDCVFGPQVKGNDTFVNETVANGSGSNWNGLLK